MKKVWQIFQNLWLKIVWWTSSKHKNLAWNLWVLDRHQMLIDMMRSAKNLEELKTWVEDKNQEEPILLPGSLVEENGSLVLRISHWGTKVLANHFKDVLDKLEIPNYLEILFSPSGQTEAQVMVTIQRVEGITPAQKIKELKNQIQK